MKAKVISLILIMTLVLVGKSEALILTQKIGNESMQTTVEENQTVKMKFISKEGFRFKRWVIEEGVINGIDTTSNEIEFKMPNSNITIKGEYDSEYIITFNGNGGATASGETTYTMGIVAEATTSLKSNEFIRSGYKFKGWSTEQDETIEYEDGASCKPTSNITLYAVWEIDTVTVKFNSNGGSAVSNITVTYGGTYGTLPTSTKTGYTLQGWYKESGLTNKVTSTTEVSTTSTHTLYAKWTANKYTVVYNANGGTGSMNNSTHTYGTESNLTANVFSNTGLTFAGWATSENSEVRYTDGQSVSTLTTENNGIVNLYAVWEFTIASIPVGAYIEYNPAYTDTTTGQAVTSATVLGADAGTADNQTFYFSDYSDGWKVLYNDNGLITLISAESIGDLTLGTKSTVSTDEYDTKFDASKTAYAKSIYTLNKLCNEWGKGELADGGRSLGYGGDYPGPYNLFDEGITLDDITHEKLREKIDGGTLSSPYRPYSSSGFATEIDLIINTQAANGSYLLMHAVEYVWLASRAALVNIDRSGFRVDVLGNDGSWADETLYERYETHYGLAESHSKGVRPVVILKSGLNLVKTEGKDGSSATSAYVLN